MSLSTEECRSSDLGLNVGGCQKEELGGRKRSPLPGEEKKREEREERREGREREERRGKNALGAY